MVDYTRNSLFDGFGLTTLKDRYLNKGQDPQDRFWDIACYYGSNVGHSERMYNYMSNHWYMAASPVLSNGGTDKGYNISCFLGQFKDNLTSITDTWAEITHLSGMGGGIGEDWSGVRSCFENTKNGTKSSGIIPFIKTMDSISLAVNQGSNRKGAMAVYLHISHPEIEEFLEIRKTSGDVNRRVVTLNNAICIPDAFMKAIEDDLDWNLIGVKDKEIKKTLKARDLWAKIIEIRAATNEPYLLFIDNCQTNDIYKELGLKVTQSNLCCEVTLHTGEDHLGNDRTAVCCLGSVNAKYYDEWKKDELFIQDCLEFKDNLLTDFINKTEGKKGFEKARYSAMRERSVGMGLMGFHTYLQEHNIPFESALAVSFNRNIFKHISDKAKEANTYLANLRGPCPDALDAGIHKRLSHCIAIAPTANISIIAGGCSPCIEPWNTNYFTHKTLSGFFEVKNKSLEKELEKLGMNTKKIWTSILKHNGSIQHLNLPEWLKLVYKTAIEIDQRWIIQHAADRKDFVDQSQSVNMFVPTIVSKKALLKLHFSAWKRGIKGLYYLRTTKLDKVNFIEEKLDTECMACQ